MVFVSTLSIQVNCLTEFNDSNNSTLLVPRWLLCGPVDVSGQNLTHLMIMFDGHQL